MCIVLNIAELTNILQRILNKNFFFLKQLSYKKFNVCFKKKKRVKKNIDKKYKREKKNKTLVLPQNSPLVINESNMNVILRGTIRGRRKEKEKL